VQAMEGIAYFLSNGIEVEADYFAIGVQILDKITKEKRLPMKPSLMSERPSHFQMTISMLHTHTCSLTCVFSLEDLRFIFSEINRVLKPNGFNFFSVRNQNDNGSGIEIEKGIYDINGFQIRFFTEKEIHGLAEEVEILWIREGVCRA
jgi:SAM-dependent methyltransferase